MESRAQNKKNDQKTSWVKKWSRSKAGKCYYFNVNTGESTWTQPDGFVPEGPNTSTCNEVKKPSKRKSSSDPSPTEKKQKIGSNSEVNRVRDTEKSSSSVTNPKLPKKDGCPVSQSVASVSEKPIQLKDVISVKKKEKRSEIPKVNIPETNSVKASQQQNIRAKTSHPPNSKTGYERAVENSTEVTKRKRTRKRKKPSSTNPAKTEAVDLVNNSHASSVNVRVKTTVKQAIHLKNARNQNTSSLKDTSICLQKEPTTSKAPIFRSAQERLKNLQSALCHSRVGLNLPSEQTAPQKLSEQALQKVPQKLPEQVLNRIPSKLSDHVLEKVSSKLPDKSWTKRDDFVTGFECEGQGRLHNSHGNLENRKGTETYMGTAQSRLKRLQDSLRASEVLKELTQGIHNDRASIIPQQKMTSSVTPQHFVDCAETKGHLNNNLEDWEAMDVEYMEAEVLSDIGVLRQNDISLELCNPTVFMDVDIHLETPAPEPNSKSVVQVVLDTNILLSHLPFVKELRDSSIAGSCEVQLFLPWQVLHELDHLKDKGKQNIQSLARRAINYLHENFSSRHPRVRGQKLNDATKNASCNPDDNILQACLQLQEQGHNVILVSNDTNLLNKALVCSVSAFSKDRFVKQLSENKQINESSLLTKPTANLLVQECVSQPMQLSDIVMSDFTAIVKKTLTEVVSNGMESEYKSLWKKRTLIPPPWDVGQVLRCLCHHWLPICGDFVPTHVKIVIEGLIDFFKTKTTRTGVLVSDIKHGLQQVEALFAAFPKKYSSIVSSCEHEFQALKAKLEGKLLPAMVPSNAPTNTVDKNFLVLSCFEEAHNAVKSLCTLDSLTDAAFRQKAECMLKAVRSLIQLMTVLLSNPVETLNAEHPLVCELTNLIKGDKPISTEDVANFCREESNRVLMENGIQQFISFETQLSTLTDQVEKEVHLSTFSCDF